MMASAVLSSRLFTATVRSMSRAITRQRQLDSTLIERENIACDDEAEQCIELNLTPLPFEPPPGAHCMVAVRVMWIGGDIDRTVYYKSFRRRSSSEHTLRSALCYPEAVIDTIDTGVITVCKSKMMTGWMPVGHNWWHHGVENDLCPCCGDPD
jgi:hypothetical protein